MAKGQKFIKRNRPPRVQIEYDTELYGSDKAVELPFIMGVMADLSGNPKDQLDPVTKRKFVDIDAETFNDKLKAMKPRVAFQVPNVVTKDAGDLSVDITFESMDDFSPAKVAQKVKGLDKLYQARTQLENLLANIDGKDAAVKKLTEAMNNPALLQALVSGTEDASGGGGEDAPAEPKAEGEE